MLLLKYIRARLLGDILLRLLTIGGWNKPAATTFLKTTFLLRHSNL